MVPYHLCFFNKSSFPAPRHPHWKDPPRCEVTRPVEPKRTAAVHVNTPPILRKLIDFRSSIVFCLKSQVLLFFKTFYLLLYILDWLFGELGVKSSNPVKSLLKGQLNSVNCERSHLFQQPNTDPPADVFKLSSSQGRITKTYMFQVVRTTSQMVDILTVVVLVFTCHLFFFRNQKRMWIDLQL